jgi:DNA-binding CsgD family transcriptional regulator
MAELDQFSSLITDIYDAALDASLWPSILRKLCAFVPGAYGNIFIQDAAQQSANSVFTWGMNHDYFQSYLEKYANSNPLIPRILLREVGDVFSTFDLMPRAQFAQTRLYQEWVQPQGILDSVSAVLEKTATSCAILALPQPAPSGAVTEAMRHRMRLVVPHVQRAVLIGKAFDLRTAVAADFATVVDSMRTAIYLLDAEQRIVHANRSGLDIVTEDTVLGSIGGKLRVLNRASDQTLRTLLEAAVSGDDLRNGMHGPLHLPSRVGEHYVAHVLPLKAGTRRETADAHHAIAALFVHRAAQNLSPMPEILARAYDLTPRELGVLLAVVEASGIAEVAAVLGLSQATVKTHLRQVFVKTSTKRQADLVRLVAGFASPVGST